MNRKGTILFIALLLSAATACAQQPNVFESQGCGVCHKPSGGVANPSLIDISKNYTDREGQLIKYFKGEAEPVINPQRAGIMKPHLEKTKALSDADLKNLADFIMNHKQ